MNFSFLHPLFLWGLPLAAGPLVIHWLTRPNPRPLPFSSLELLRRTARARLRASRLRNYFLLFLRCALLACLVLLFARPAAHLSSGPGAAGAPLSAVLLVDVSYSMAARRAGVSSLERAVERAEGFLDGAGPADWFGLVVFSDRVETSVPPAGGAAAAREALAGLAATARPTRVRPALEAAYRLLAAEAEGRKVIIVLSDLAENGWREEAPVPGFDPEVLLFFS
ncbi:MAG: vWA domain-containing protein, partial [Elusimicrobiota bacterium]